MNTPLFRMICVGAGLMAPIGFTMKGSGSLPRVEEGHQSGVTAKITLRDGAARTVRLEGVGCTASLCSRTAIKGAVGHDSVLKTWLDSIAAIKDTTEADTLFVMKDGTQKRMSLLKDFRVLYLADGTRLDLAKIKTVEFLAPLR